MMMCMQVEIVGELLFIDKSIQIVAFQVKILKICY